MRRAWQREKDQKAHRVCCPCMQSSPVCFLLSSQESTLPWMCLSLHSSLVFLGQANSVLYLVLGAHSPSPSGCPAPTGGLCLSSSLCCSLCCALRPKGVGQPFAQRALGNPRGQRNGATAPGGKQGCPAPRGGWGKRQIRVARRRKGMGKSRGHKKATLLSFSLCCGLFFLRSSFRSFFPWFAKQAQGSEERAAREKVELFSLPTQGGDKTLLGIPGRRAPLASKVIPCVLSRAELLQAAGLVLLLVSRGQAQQPKGLPSSLCDPFGQRAQQREQQGSKALSGLKSSREKRKAGHIHYPTGSRAE